ncbi:MAG: NAD(P)H-hydrate epimerase, partial [Nitrospirae bacterium]
MKIVTAAQMQALDHRAITEAHIPSLTLMENAGSSVVAAMAQIFGSLAGKTVAILCGKGHNGGDGFVVARLLKRKRARVQVLLMARVADLADDTKTMYRRFVRAGGDSAVLACPSSAKLQTLLKNSDLIVDALLGTGLSAPITGPYGTAIGCINDADRPVTAVDLPSGIHADTGEVLGAAVQATLTVTFALPKLGLYI